MAMTKEQFKEAREFFTNFAAFLDLKGKTKLTKAMEITTETFDIAIKMMSKGVLTSDQTNALCDLTTVFNDCFLMVLNKRLEELGVETKKEVIK